MTLRLTVLILAFAALSTTLAPRSYGAAQDARHFTVDVIAIQGEEFIVKEAAGTQGKIHVGPDTEKYGHFQPGDRIEAWVYPNGHAKTVIIARSAATIQEDQLQHAQSEDQAAQRAQR